MISVTQGFRPRTTSAAARNGEAPFDRSRRGKNRPLFITATTDMKPRRPLMRLQISADGLSHYLYAILKNYNFGEYDGSGGPPPGSSPKAAESRYSPGRLLSIAPGSRIGSPDENHISTLYTERWNADAAPPRHPADELVFEVKFENHRLLIAMTVVF